MPAHSLPSLLRPPLSLILPVFEPNMSGASDATGFWVLPRPVNAEFLDYVLTSKGDPYWASDRFGRMLYLSATTITTLGLGDITPISSEARLLIGIEALLGIVLIGLFLNDLANRLRSVT